MKNAILSTLSFLFLSGFGTAGLAQDQFPRLEDTTEALAAVRIVYGAFDKQEIPIDGYIGSLIGDTLYFQDQNGKYKVTLDAGRAIRKEISDCEIDWFSLAKSNCSATGMAEVKVIWDKADLSSGMKIELIIYELQVTHR